MAFMKPKTKDSAAKLPGATGAFSYLIGSKAIPGVADKVFGEDVTVELRKKYPHLDAGTLARMASGEDIGVDAALIKQEIESMKGEARSRLSLRRKRGFLSTILAGATNTPLSKSGNTLLGQ